MQGYIWTFDLFSAEEIAASDNASSDACDVRATAPNDKFAIHYTITGTGTLKLEYLLSYYEGGTYLTPAGASDIATGLVAGSDIVVLTPYAIAPFMKIKATETGGVNAATITAHLMTK